MSNAQGQNPTVPAEPTGWSTYLPTLTINRPRRTRSTSSSGAGASQASPRRKRSYTLSNGVILLACVLIGRLLDWPTALFAAPLAFAILVVMLVVIAIFGKVRGKSLNVNDNAVALVLIGAVLSAFILMFLAGASFALYKIGTGNVSIDTNTDAFSWQTAFCAVIMVGFIAVVRSRGVRPQALPDQSSGLTSAQLHTRFNASPNGSSSNGTATPATSNQP